MDELKAINACWKAVKKLDKDAKRRVLDYVKELVEKDVSLTQAEDK
jgi:hypothetical protein